MVNVAEQHRQTSMEPGQDTPDASRVTAKYFPLHALMAGSIQ